jgi:hypothetical protein
LQSGLGAGCRAEDKGRRNAKSNRAISGLHRFDIIREFASEDAIGCGVAH